MPTRSLGKLKAITVDRCTQKGRLSDGGGLYLNVTKTGSKSWLFMWSRKTGEKTTKRYEMGLGPFPAVTLAMARKRAEECRTQVAEGINPIEERHKLIKKTFGQVADELVESIKSEWSNAKHEYQWRQSLEQYCKGIRGIPIADVSTENVLAVLRPIWLEKHETATRVRSRIERVIDYAKANGWREADNPARWRGHLKDILPKKKRGEASHYAAMPSQEVPDFVRQLKEREAIAALALEFTILTAARTSEVLNSKWNEFDLKNNVWIVPAERMKMRKTHRVPLSDRCSKILEQLSQTSISDYVFPGQKLGRPLSNMSLNMLLRRMGVENATTHGFRSSFRDWVGDETSFPREIVEAALAHKVGDEVEQAYRRSDALEKRRRLMEAWADYCQSKQSESVVKLRA